MAKWYEDDVSIAFIIQHLIDLCISIFLFISFVWQIASESQAAFRKQPGIPKLFHEISGEDASTSSFIHFVHRLGLTLSIIYVIRNLDPFAMLDILSFKIITFISNNIILSYLIYGMLLIYEPLSNYYCHNSCVLNTIQCVFIILALVNIVFTNLSSWFMFTEQQDFWSRVFTIYWISFAYAICSSLIILLQKKYNLVLDVKENSNRLSTEKDQSLSMKLKNFRKTQFSLFLVICLLGPYIYLICLPSHQIVKEPDPQRFDTLRDGLSTWARIFCLCIILYQSWIPLQPCCWCDVPIANYPRQALVLNQVLVNGPNTQTNIKINRKNSRRRTTSGNFRVVGSRSNSLSIGGSESVDDFRRFPNSRTR